MALYAEAPVNEYYELLFWCARAYIVLCAVFSVYLVGFILYERYVEGNVDAFKPDPRYLPFDRRSERPSR